MRLMIDEVNELRHLALKLGSERDDALAENERLREQIAWTIKRCNAAMGDDFSGNEDSAVAAVCDEVERLREASRLPSVGQRMTVVERWGRTVRLVVVAVDQTTGEVTVAHEGQVTG